MNTLRQSWISLTAPLSKGEKEARREHITRVIFVMVSAGLLLMSIIVPFYDFSVGEPEYTGTFLMLLADSLMITGWLLVYRGRWDVSRYLLPATFLALGGYFFYNVGLITTGVLQLAIAIILTALLFGSKAQWVVVVFSLILYLTLGWLAGERDIEVFFTGGIVVGFSLSGIALLQWFSSTLLKASIERLRNAETESRESAEKIRAIFESINDGITITDLQGNISDVNQAVLEMHGFENRDELIGQGAFLLITERDHSTAMENLQLTLTHETSGLLEYTFLKKNGEEFDGELNAVLIKDVVGNPAGFVALTRDISPRKQAEAEREILIAELKSKNEELERFTYTVSHDLKAPLITIGGFLGYLEDDILDGNSERVKQDVERINDAVKKMNQLLNELLELSRIGRMMNPPEDIPFEKIVREALGKVQGRLNDNKVKVKVSNDLPVVHGDHVRLVEAVQNLLDNAAKFMGAQPRPEIEIGQQGQENGMPIIFVKDNGIGIAPEHHELVFALFQRLDPKTDGTGIGLALVKRIVEFHGGKIWVESESSPQAVSPSRSTFDARDERRRARDPNGGEAGKGATFYFTLPPPPVAE